MFSLGNFEGPLDLLWQLVTKDELDIATIPLHLVTSQFAEAQSHRDVESSKINDGAEFIALAATLIWYKSLKLLPKTHQDLSAEALIPTDEDPSNILHHLIDYCRFKQAAKELSSLEHQQSYIYHRGVEASAPHAPSIGIHHLSLDDLAKLFQKILAKSRPHVRTLKEDPWKVSDKIAFLLILLEERQRELFEVVFHEDLSREELIVTFLALLELMKAGKLGVSYVDEKYMILKMG